MTLSHPPTTRNPRPVSDRRSHQCARPGWRPPYLSPQQQAERIAESIKSRIAEGLSWSLSDYGIEGNESMIQLVTHHLS